MPLDSAIRARGDSLGRTNLGAIGKTALAAVSPLPQPPVELMVNMIEQHYDGREENNIVDHHGEPEHFRWYYTF